MKLCLVTEGTYPYQVGGVSTWTDTLLRGLPDLDIVLAPLYTGESPGRPIWPLPPNVTSVHPIQVPASLAPADILPWSESASSQLPPTDLVHTLTAGVSGQLGRALQRDRDIPHLVTEHGVGWYELQHGPGETETGFRPEAVADAHSASDRRERGVRHLRQHAREVYSSATHITAVAWSTQEKQYALGADPARCEVIPNGVQISPFPSLPQTSSSPHIGLVGRITPLKDIETFLWACAHVQASLPSARFTIVGPPSDPDYTAQCRALARRLGLMEALTFVEDAHSMSRWYQQFDVVVLTSKSEAQPLALLEAMAHARPVVATDVGDCRRLVEGPDDAYGPAGKICAPGNAEAIGEALSTLATTPIVRRRQGWTGWQRIQAFYRCDQMISAYRRLYSNLTARTEPLTLAIS